VLYSFIDFCDTRNGKKGKEKSDTLFLFSLWSDRFLKYKYKNLKALVEAGVIKLPNIGIHYDNLRNTIIRETTKAGNSVYAEFD